MVATPALDRRHVLMAAVASVIAVPVLASCGSSTDSKAKSSGAAQAGSKVASSSEVPVGGGLIVQDQGIVVTQPTKGEYHAFSNICTHQGCPVSAVTKTIDCDCHGSSFALTDGAVVAGPAPSPLSSIGIKVAGGEIVLT